MAKESSVGNSLYSPKVSLSSCREKVFDIVRLGHIHVSVRNTLTGHSTTAKTKNLIPVTELPPQSFDEYRERFVK